MSSSAVLSEMDVDALRQKCFAMGLSPKSWVKSKLIQQIEDAESGTSPFDAYAVSHERMPGMRRFAPPPQKLPGTGQTHSGSFSNRTDLDDVEVLKAMSFPPSRSEPVTTSLGGRPVKSSSTPDWRGSAAPQSSGIVKLSGSPAPQSSAMPSAHQKQHKPIPPPKDTSIPMSAVVPPPPVLNAEHSPKSDRRIEDHARRLSLSEMTVDQLRKKCIDMGLKPQSWVGRKLIAQIQEAEAGGSKYDQYAMSHERMAGMRRFAPPPPKGGTPPSPSHRTDLDDLPPTRPQRGPSIDASNRSSSTVGKKPVPAPRSDWKAGGSLPHPRSTGPPSPTNSIQSSASVDSTRPPRLVARNSAPWMKPPVVDRQKRPSLPGTSPPIPSKTSSPISSKTGSSWMKSRAPAPAPSIPDWLAGGSLPHPRSSSNQHDPTVRAPSPTNSVTSSTSEDISEERRRFHAEKEAWEADKKKLLDALEMEKLAFEREQMEQEKEDWELEKRRIQEQKDQIEIMRANRIKERGEQIYSVPTHASSGGRWNDRTDLDSMYDDIDLAYRGSDDDIDVGDVDDRGPSDFASHSRRFSGCSHMSVVSDAFTDWSAVSQTWKFDEVVDSGSDLDGKSPEELKGILSSYGHTQPIWDVGKLKAAICQARADAKMK